MAFEFATVLADTAKDLNIEVNRDLVERAEEILIREFRSKSPEQFACEMNVLVLAALEPKDKPQK